MKELAEIGATLDKLTKKYGEGAIRRMGDIPQQKIEVFSTSCLSLDKAIGQGGFPRGRIIEVYGQESSGKTTLALHVAASAQKEGGLVGYVDAEHALDMDYCRALGVDVDNLLVSQPGCGEEALEIVEALVRSERVAVVVVDSVAALVPQAELNGEMGDSVSFDTPIFIKNKTTGEFDIVSIQSLYKGSKEFYGKRYINRYKKVKNLEVLTSSGWRQLKTVFFKRNKNQKPLIITNTSSGSACTTKDHSLFVEGQEKSPSELNIGDILDHNLKVKIESKGILNEDLAWVLGFYCAEGHQSSKNVFEVSNTEYDRIEKVQKIINKYFLCKTKITSYINPDGIRKPLYKLIINSNELLSYILNDCTDPTGFKKVPKVILNDSRIQLAFLNGFKEGDGDNNVNEINLYSSSQILMAGLVYMFQNLGMLYSLSVRHREGRLPEYILQESTSHNLYKPHTIKRFIEYQTPEFLYDIETEDGTFVGGIGGILLHNSVMGLQARLMSQACRKLVACVSHSNTCLIFINQMRDKIGISWGPSTTTTGGKSLKFYASLRLEIARIGQIKDSADQVIGNRTKVKVVKNKVAPPFRVCEFDIMYGKGISRAGDIIDMALEAGVLVQKTSWFSYGDVKLGQGKENIRTMLENDQELANEIASKI